MSRNFVYSTISAGSAALLLVLSIIITNTLGQPAWGGFSFALALSMIGETLMDFGIHQVTIRSIARDRSHAETLFRNSLALKALPAVAMFAALSGVAIVMKPDADVRVASILVVGSAVFRSYVLTVRGVLQGLERFGDDAFVVVLDRFVVLVFCSVALWSGAGLTGVAGAFLGARVVAAIAALVAARRHVGTARPAFDPSVWRDLQRRAMPLGAFLLVLNVYSYVDTIILSALTNDLETGLYNSAYKIYEGLTYPTAILSSVLTPRLSHLWSVDRAAHAALVRRGLGGSVLLGIVLAFVAWALAPVVIQAFGADAAPAADALRILSVGLPLVFAIWILHAVAISVFEERWLFRTAVVGTIANVGLNFYLIPPYGRNGAAAATVLGELISLIVLLWALRRSIGSAGRGE